MDSGYFKNEAKKALEGKWQAFSLCVLIFQAINIAINLPSLILQIHMLYTNYTAAYSIVNPVESLVSDLLSLLGNGISLFVLQHLSFGLYLVALKVSRNENFDTSDLFRGFKNYGSIFIVSILKELYVFLWLLLFIIPGIIKSLSYSMVYFIMIENPSIKPSEALKESEKLMEGYKLDFFMLQLSFIGWILLSIITLNISSIWSDPYFYTAQAEFYEKIKKDKYGDAIPYVESEEQYIQYPYDYMTYQPSAEHETYFDYNSQTVEPTYTYLGIQSSPVISEETAPPEDNSEEMQVIDSDIQQ